MILIFFGPPGSGKGTQAQRIKDKYNMYHMSTGEALRSEVAAESELGLAAKAAMEAGELVSDEIVVGIVSNALNIVGGYDGIILDGFPRNLDQAKILDEKLEESDKKIDAVISLEVDREMILKRLAGRRMCQGCKTDYNVYFNPPPDDNECPKCGDQVICRKDDNEQTILDRLNVYENETFPLKEYYASKGLIHPISSSDIDSVFHECCKAIDSAKD